MLVVKKTQYRPDTGTHSSPSPYQRWKSQRSATVRQFPTAGTAESTQRIKHNRYVKRVVNAHHGPH